MKAKRERRKEDYMFWVFISSLAIIGLSSFYVNFIAIPYELESGCAESCDKLNLSFGGISDSIRLDDGAKEKLCKCIPSECIINKEYRVVQNDEGFFDWIFDTQCPILYLNKI